MNSQHVYFELTETSDARFDRVIEVLLIALLLFAPLAFGAVHPLSELIVLAIAAAMLITLLGKLLVRPDVHFVWSWTYLPIAAFIALVLLQLIPLPAEFTRSISSETVKLREQILASLPGERLRPMPLSFDTEATLSNFRMMLAVSVVFIVVVNVIRRLRQVRRILGAIALIGTAVALLALAQDITEASAIYWFIPLEGGEAIAGPFVNHNHFAQFMNLSMGAALGLLLMQLDELPSDVEFTGAVTSSALARPVSRPIWLLACGIVAMAVSVPLSLSRGGMIAMAAGGIFTAIILGTRRSMRRRAWLFVGIVLVVSLMIVLLQFESVYQRATRLDDPVAVSARIDALQGSLQIWRKFPVAGVGLGAFDLVFPQFDPSLNPLAARYADNDYAQLLAETGLIGAVCAVFFLALVAMAYARAVRRTPSQMASAALGIGFGYVAILVQSSADFGQHLPAVAMLTAIFSAILLNLAATARRAGAPPDQIPARGHLWLRVAASVLLCTSIGLVLFDGFTTMRADLLRRQSANVERELVAQNWLGSDQDFAELLLPMQRAADLRPRDARLRYTLNRYRWKSLERQMPLDEIDRVHARRIIHDVSAHAWRAPTYALPYLLAGQIQSNVLDERPAGDRLIQLALRLNRNHPDICMEAAVVAARERDWVGSRELFDRAIALDPQYRHAVIETLVLRLHRDDLAMEYAMDDLASMRNLSELLKRSDEVLSVEASVRADELLLEQAARRDAPASVLVEAAELHIRRAEHEAAIELLRRAAAIEFSSIPTRLLLARTLHSAGHEREAITEVQTLLSQFPTNTDARRLRDEWTHRERIQEQETPTTIPASTEPATFKFD